MKRLALLILSLALCSCAVSTAEEEERLCDDANVDPSICSTLYGSAKGDEMADQDSRLRGIIVERVGNRTHFKIPLAYALEGDQRRLMHETIKKFNDEMGRLNREMIGRGIDLSGVLGLADTADFQAGYEDTIASIFDADLEGDMELLVGEQVDNPRQLRAWQRYLVPQAFLFYFGTKFHVNLGIGGGLSATIMVVVQPWLTVAVDHTTDEPTVVDKGVEVDAAVLGIPNVDVGFGVGSGLPVRIGAGLVFGPMDHPEDLAGWGAGLSGSFGIPIAGGGQGKFVTVLRDPPLMIGMLGYQTGTTVDFSVHGNLQYLMDLGELLDWIATTTGVGQ